MRQPHRRHWEAGLPRPKPLAAQLTVAGDTELPQELRYPPHTFPDPLFQSASLQTTLRPWAVSAAPTQSSEQHLSCLPAA